MKRTNFTDEQIIGILAEHEVGEKCADLWRRHGMSEGTFYIYGLRLYELPRSAPALRAEAVWKLDFSKFP